MSAIVGQGWPLTSTDVCLRLFLQCQHSWQMPFLPGQTILEVGCAEANWLEMASKSVPNLTLWGVDPRPCRRPGMVIRGDVRDLTQIATFPAGQLDWVVLVSALEHIGLTHYGDPAFSDGDVTTLGLAASWLKPGGHLYFDVPWHPGQGDSIHGDTAYRVYDDARITRLAEGWVINQTAWSGVKETSTMLLATRPEAAQMPEQGWVYQAQWWTKP